MAIPTSELPPLTPLACVVVDDNEMSRLMLQHYVDITDGLTLAGAFADGVSCLNYFRAGGAADLLLLDINMPELTGLDLVRILPAPQPEVVLVTSHRDYAVDAFELQVSDYLVKPLDYARFIRTVDRIRSKRAALPPPAGATAAAPVQDGRQTHCQKKKNPPMAVKILRRGALHRGHVDVLGACYAQAQAHRICHAQDAGGEAALCALYARAPLLYG